MNFTFGILISPETPEWRLEEMLKSIWGVAQELNYLEVILAGQLSDECFRLVRGFSNEFSVKYLAYEGPADKPGHITKKKNMIAEIAFFDNLCLMHDYFYLPADFAFWVPKKYNIYVPPIHTAEGDRHSDWLVNPEKLQKYIHDTPGIDDALMSEAPHENAPKYVCAVPYARNDLVPIQYVSGGFIVCKTDVVRDNPFNEDLYWGQAEDLEWSERVVPKYGMTTNAWKEGIQSVRVLKPNKWAVTQMPAHIIEGLKQYYGL
jgi:hypothetical protein